MLVKIDKRRVDVCRRDCGERPCFRLGFDKGSFTPGVGYTSYHRDAKGRHVERPVCQTRHLHGCPHPSVCPTCRTLSVCGPGERCEQSRNVLGPDGRWTLAHCDGVLVPDTAEETRS